MFNLEPKIYSNVSIKIYPHLYSDVMKQPISTHFASVAEIKMAYLKKFLSSSTIHGLCYLIPTSLEDKKVIIVLIQNTFAHLPNSS